jgi:hypothetical protein
MADELKPPRVSGLSEIPAQPAAPAKPAEIASGRKQDPAPAPKPAPKPSVKPEPWGSPLVEELQRRFPGAISDALIFRGQPFFSVQKEKLIEVGEFLKSDAGGSYVFLTDQTAVDYPKREKRFEIIYQLYSFAHNDRLRMKVPAAEGENVPSVTGIWPGANGWSAKSLTCSGSCSRDIPA